jgi:hypothetical protein
MKVKIIGGSNYKDLEYDINQFIKDKRVIDIKYQAKYVVVHYRGCVPDSGTIIDRVFIMYEEN